MTAEDHERRKMDAAMMQLAGLSRVLRHVMIWDKIRSTQLVSVPGMLYKTYG